MSKTFRPWNPEQTLLLPPSPVDWLPQNHLVFFLLDLAAELDLGEIHAYYHQKDPIPPPNGAGASLTAKYPNGNSRGSCSAIPTGW